MPTSKHFSTTTEFTRAGAHPGAGELSQILGIKERSLMTATFGKTLRQDCDNYNKIQDSIQHLSESRKISPR
jgi:hypothetical protein